MSFHVGQRVRLKDPDSYSEFVRKYGECGVVSSDPDRNDVVRVRFAKAPYDTAVACKNLMPLPDPIDILIDEIRS